jgi:hypothetical protein
VSSFSKLLVWLDVDEYLTRSHRTIGGEIDERDRKDYFSPSTNLFADYCASIIERYGLDEPGQILQREATDISYGYLSDSSPSKAFTITTSTGERFYSRTVVLAIGPGGAGVSKYIPGSHLLNKRALLPVATAWRSSNFLALMCIARSSDARRQMLLLLEGGCLQHRLSIWPFAKA